jgi:hypothetical protein
MNQFWVNVESFGNTDCQSVLSCVANFHNLKSEAVEVKETESYVAL